MEGVNEDLRLSRWRPDGKGGVAAETPNADGRDWVKVEHVLAAEPRRAAVSAKSIGGCVGEKPTLRIGEFGCGEGIGGTGEMT